MRSIFLLLLLIVAFSCPSPSFSQNESNEISTGINEIKSEVKTEDSANKDSIKKIELKVDEQEKTIDSNLDTEKNETVQTIADSENTSSDSDDVKIIIDDKDKNTIPIELKSDFESGKIKEEEVVKTSATIKEKSSEQKIRELVSTDIDSGYPVTFFNRKIISLRRDTTEWPAEFRAKHATSNIAKAFSSSKGGSVKAVKIKYGYDIRRGDTSLFRILEGDADPDEGISLENYAKTATKNLIEAAKEYHKQQSIWVIITSIVAVIFFIIILYLLLLLIKIIRNYCDQNLEKWLKGILAKFASLEFAKKYAKSFALSLNKALTFLMYVCFVLFFYTCLTLILSYIPYTKPWTVGLLKSIIAIVTAFFSGFINMLPGIIIFILILFSTKIIVNLVNIFFDGVANNDIKFPGIDNDTIVPTKRISAAFIWIVGIGLAYPFIPGSESDAFKGLSVILGLMVSLGSTNIINQAISGLILIYSKTLKIGDFVKIKDNEGYVISTGVFNVKLRSAMNEEIIVPNSVFLDSSILNYSKLKKDKGVAFAVAVGLDYNVPWRQVNAMLLEAARRTTSLKKNSKPYVWQTEMADYYMEYKLVVWVDAPEMKSKIRSELYSNIQDVFNEYGVQIMTPRYLTIYKDKIWSPKEEWFMEPADPNENVMETFGFDVSNHSDEKIKKD